MKKTLEQVCKEYKIKRPNSLHFLSTAFEIAYAKSSGKLNTTTLLQSFKKEFEKITFIEDKITWLEAALESVPLTIPEGKPIFNFINSQLPQLYSETKSSTYGTHSENRAWVISTWNSVRENKPSDRQADIETNKLYREKFGLSISTSQIQRFTGRQ